MLLKDSGGKSRETGRKERLRIRQRKRKRREKREWRGRANRLTEDEGEEKSLNTTD